MTAQDSPGPVRPAAARWPDFGQRPGLGVLAVLGLTGYAWFASGLPAFSGRALAGVFIPGAALGLIAYGRPPERIPAPDRLDVTGFSYWAICVAALLEWEASAFRDNSLPWHPSLTGLIDPLIQPHPVRGAAFLVWLLAGWALIRR